MAGQLKRGGGTGEAAAAAGAGAAVTQQVAWADAISCSNGSNLHGDARMGVCCCVVLNI
jgi:hypothetical protein